MDTQNHKGKTCVVDNSTLCQEGYCGECEIYRQSVTLFTNDLKKGIKIHLRNGWDARIEDNLKGNTRLCTVYGDFTEMGSVYSHDIIAYYKDSTDVDIDVARMNCDLCPIEHTPQQLKLKSQVSALGF